MTQRSNSAGIEPLVSRRAHFSAVSAALKLFVGRGRRFSYKEIQKGAGVPERMIECWRHDMDHEDWREILPEQLASLQKFLGPDFTTEYLSLVADQGAYWLPDSEDIPPGALAADSADDNATLAHMAADGKFDDKEKPDLKVVGRRMMIRGATLKALAA